MSGAPVIRYYLQFPDFHVEKGEPVRWDAARDLLEEFPPEEVRTEYVMAAEAQQRACPPVVGFESDTGAFLEVAWLASGERTLRARVPRPRRLLGLHWRSWAERTVELPDLKTAANALLLLFSDSDEHLWNLLARLRPAE